MKMSDIKRNLKKVEEGKALDIPLAVLNGKFKKKYQKETQRLVGRENYRLGKYRYPEKWKENYQKNKERIKKTQKKYHKTAKYRKVMRNYQIRNREKLNARSRKWYAEHKPYFRNYYQRRKERK